MTTPTQPSGKTDSSADRLLIHVGYHKTGTSYLQRLVFNDAAQGFCSPVDRHLLRDVFVRSSPYAFDPAATRAAFLPQVAQVSAARLVPVLSHEQFTGQPAGGGYGLRRREREASRKEVAERIHNTFPEARILIVIREQSAMAHSIYKWLVCGWEGRLSASIEQFLDQSPLEHGYSPLFNFEYLEYHWVIQHFRKLYGDSAVLTLPYEWLRKDPLSFVNRIRVFVDLPHVDRIPTEHINVGRSAASCQVKRWLNRIVVSPNRPGSVSRAERWAARYSTRLGKYLPGAMHARAEADLKQRIGRLLAGVYAQSNDKTARLTGIDLDAWGYEMPSGNASKQSLAHSIASSTT